MTRRAGGGTLAGVEATAARMTADEFLAGVESNRIENLIDGVLFVNEPTVPHQGVLMRLLLALGTWCTAADGRGEAFPSLDVRIDARSVYEPDACWFASPREPYSQNERYAVPDLAVEIRSPGTWRHDIGRKREGYERAGLPELWLVDHLGGAIIVARRSAPAMARFDVELELLPGDVLTSPQLPGFALAVDALFAT